MHSRPNHPFISSFYFGDTTPESDPTHYMTLVARLLKTYYGSLYASGIPLVINTGGWVHGIGLDLCVDLVRAAKCTHVCQLGERSALGRPRDMPDLVTMAMTERANAYRWLAASECSLRRNDGPWQPLSIYFDIVAAGPESERGITRYSS